MKDQTITTRRGQPMARSVIVLACCLISWSVWIPTYAQEAPSPPAALLPDAAAQEESKRLILDIHRDDFENAKTPAQKTALAKLLTKEGIKTEGDKAGQYMLFQIAADLAVEAGDVEAGFAAVEQLADRFSVDPYPAKLAIVIAAEKVPRSPKERLALFTVVDEFTVEMITEDQYSLAKKSAEAAMSLARRSQDVSAVKAANARQEEILNSEKAFRKVQDANQTLAVTPDDSTANAIVGKFTCTVKRDWDRGLAMVLKGDDATWRRIAEKDIAKPTTPEGKADVADEWWALADALQGAERKVVQQRAVFWYQQALPELDGLAKAKAANRIAEVAAVPNKDEAPLVLTITARIRAMDKVDIDRKGATWSRLPAPKGGTYEVATRVKIADKDWNVEESPVIAFEPLDPVLAGKLSRADFSTVRLVKKHARGNVQFQRSKTGCTIVVHDPQSGSDQYEFELQFEK